MSSSRRLPSDESAFSNLNCFLEGPQSQQSAIPFSLPDANFYRRIDTSQPLWPRPGRVEYSITTNDEETSSLYHSNGPKELKAQWNFRRKTYWISSLFSRGMEIIDAPNGWLKVGYADHIPTASFKSYGGDISTWECLGYRFICKSESGAILAGWERGLNDEYSRLYLPDSVSLSVEYIVSLMYLRVLFSRQFGSNGPQGWYPRA